MEHKYCIRCKFVREGNFCWNCGNERISVKLDCPHCEKPVSMIDKFCTNCGKPIQEAIQAHIQKKKGGDGS